MSGLKEIRKRIGSVKNTRKITKAMKMVSAAKLRRAQDRAEASRPYAKELSSIVGNILREHSVQSPLTKSREVKKRLIVVMSSDRGLCGSLTANLIKRVHREIQASEVPVEILGLGKKGADYFARRGQKLRERHTDLMKQADFSFVKEISEKIRNAFVGEEFDQVDIAYNEFQSAILQKPVLQRLLPLDLADQSATTETNEVVGYGKSFKYEPGAEALLEKLLPMLIDFQLYRALLESFASEHAARMTAMDSASNNARDMIGRLTLKMNRARQAAITKELMEIIGGAEAIAS